MWDAILSGVFWILHWFYGFVQDWGMAIILITILVRIILYPIARKQFKSQHAMQKLQPKVNEIRAKYAGDPQRMNEEQMKIYQEAKFNPLAGCLPALLQMPVFIALYGVLVNLHNYIDASELPATFYGILPDLTRSPKDIFSGYTTGDGVAVLGDPVAAIPYILVLLLFSLSLLVPILINKNQGRQQLIMFGVMAVVMLIFGFSMPAGVLLYWDASSIIQTGHQLISKRILDAKDEAAAEEVVEIVPVKVEVERKTKKNRPKKSK